jgi:hypothetical protein
MERSPTINPTSRSRVHFNSENPSSEEAEPRVSVALLDPDPADSEDLNTDEGKSITESVAEDDAITKDITEAKKSATSFYFSESESDSEDDKVRLGRGSSWERRSSMGDNEHIHRILKFKSPSAPTSPQTTPQGSPESRYNGHRDSDIPLLELNLSKTPEGKRPDSSPPSSAETAVEQDPMQTNKLGRAPTSRAYEHGKREADRLVREHTTRKSHRPKDILRRMSTGDVLKSHGRRSPTGSGASTPEEGDYAKHYTFNSGVLTNLLKL